MVVPFWRMSRISSRTASGRHLTNGVNFLRSSRKSPPARVGSLTQTPQDVSFRGSKPSFFRKFNSAMDETLRQLGGLLLGSVPTVIMLVLLYGIYSVLVHKPLSGVLAERRAKTEGAIEKARADVAAAEARTAEYEQRLREARVAVFKSQEARRQAALQARATAVAAVRVRVQEQVQEARAAIEHDKIAAQDRLQGESARLASEIVRSVLRPVSAGAR